MDLKFYILLTTLLLQNASAKILFDGSASRGTSNVWKVLNTEGSGTKIVAVDDKTLNTKVWEFTKPKNAHRCEGHGAKGFQAKEGDDLYIGWNLQLNQDPRTLTTNSNFQWKAYPADQQNYPIVIKTINGNIVLEQYNPGKKKSTFWSGPFENVPWYSIVLCIKVPKDIKKGFVEFWFEGTQVTFANNKKTRFVCRTFDGNNVDPKWGIYGGDGENVMNRIGSIKIATTYAEASPK